MGIKPRIWIAALVCALFSPVVAQAQHELGPSKVDVAVGLAYSNLSLAGFSERRHGVGWTANVAFNINRYFALEGDFGGQYDPECSETDPECIVQLLTSTQLIDYSSYQFMGGPRLIIPGQRFDGFVHFLAGGVRTDVTLFSTITGIRTDIDEGPNFAMAVGGGLDWKVGDRFAIRLIQVDYIPVHNSVNWRHNVRIQGGVVFRFGTRR